MSGIYFIDALWEPLLKQDKMGIYSKTHAVLEILKKASWYYSHNLFIFQNYRDSMINLPLHQVCSPKLMGQGLLERAENIVRQQILE
jgi:hypothetical protein